jgi:hypothetical protein
MLIVLAYAHHQLFAGRFGVPLRPYVIVAGGGLAATDAPW